jgi:hypothetical protein
VKRTALLATLALVAVTPAVAHAAPKGSRTLTFSYSGAQGATTPAVDFNSNCSGGVGDCWEFSTLKGEKSVTITATDSSGTPTGLQVFTDGDFQTVATSCGTTTLTVSPKASTQISVRAAYSTECTGIPTNGTMKAVITKK